MTRLTFGLAMLLFFASACAPQQPTLTPQSVQLTAISTAGVHLRADLNAYNPNGFDLTVQSVSGRIVLDNRVPLGTATMPTSVFLPANGWQRFFVDLELPWLDLPAALAVAQGRPQIPYTFEGNATVGGGISITLPIRMQGVIPAQDLLRASVGLPRLGTAPAWQRRGTLLVIGVQTTGVPLPRVAAPLVLAAPATEEQAHWSPG